MLVGTTFKTHCIIAGHNIQYYQQGKKKVKQYM